MEKLEIQILWWFNQKVAVFGSIASDVSHRFSIAKEPYYSAKGNFFSSILILISGKGKLEMPSTVL